MFHRLLCALATVIKSVPDPRSKQGVSHPFAANRCFSLSPLPQGGEGTIKRPIVPGYLLLAVCGTLERVLNWCGLISITPAQVGCRPPGGTVGDSRPAPR